MPKEPPRARNNSYIDFFDDVGPKLRTPLILMDEGMGTNVRFPSTWDQATADAWRENNGLSRPEEDKRSNLRKKRSE